MIVDYVPVLEKRLIDIYRIINAMISRSILPHAVRQPFFRARSNRVHHIYIFTQSVSISHNFIHGPELEARMRLWCVCARTAPREFIYLRSSFVNATPGHTLITDFFLLLFTGCSGGGCLNWSCGIPKEGLGRALSVRSKNSMKN